MPDLFETKSACCYCGVGCGVIVTSEDGKVTAVRGDPDHPANFGRLCSKGSTLHLTTGVEARLLQPEMRLDRTVGRAVVSWDAALDHAAEKFAEIIRRDGPDAVAFYISGQLLTEDYYAFNKLARALVGTNNIDTNSRLCMSSAVTGYKMTLGADAPPTCYADVEAAECIFIAGSNTAYAHPIVFRRIEDARRNNPLQKLIVVDPRRTDTSAAADLHLPIIPGTDVALFNAMLHVMVWEGRINQQYIDAHTSGFEALRAAVTEYSPGAVADTCGVAADQIVLAARMFADSKATLSLYCQGLNQSIQGTQKNAALINLHLATGQIGRAGAGPFSLTGQPNAMGGREVGGMATLLSAHRDLNSASDRAELAKFWGVKALSDRPGLTAVPLFDALRTKQVKAVWIACTNPAQSMPDQAKVREALEAAELVVVQEAFRNAETLKYADIALPATPWSEKEGTQTNSERTITRVRAAVAPTREAKHDWQIAVEFAHRLGAKLGRSTEAVQLFPYAHVEQLFAEHRETTRGRDLDITAMDYALLETRGPQQWPFPEGSINGKRRLYEDGHYPTPDGRAHFMATKYRAPAEKINARYPLRLITGRLRDQWHGMTRTGTVARLFAHAPEPVLSMNQKDMTRRGLRDGDIVRVTSSRGAVSVLVQATDELRSGQAFLPMHWGSTHLCGVGVNAVTTAALDPMSAQPELKYAAIQVEPLHAKWSLSAMRLGDPAKYMSRMQAFLGAFDYASCTLAGRDRSVVVFRAASVQAPAQELINGLDAALDLDDDACAMTYHDPVKRIAKRALVDQGRLIGARLSGENAARDWLRDLIANAEDATRFRAWLLAPIATPPEGASASKGKVVCNCHDVGAETLIKAIAEGADFTALQAKFKCGTECGSCIPEVKRMVNAAVVAAA